MPRFTRTTLVSGAMLVAALWLLSSCNETSTAAKAETNSWDHSTASSHSLRSGTTIGVALGSNISSETANVGDVWHGTMTEAVTTKNSGTIASGSAVDGVVAGVTRAKRGSRAMLYLGVRSIRVDGQDVSVSASSEPVIAGSPRARNLGAIAGGAAVGALIGNAVGDGKGAAVGAVVGGAAVTGAVAGSKGYQVVLPNGTVMNFTVDQTVAMR
jgi:hypothetical protein